MSRDPEIRVIGGSLFPKVERLFSSLFPLSTVGWGEEGARVAPRRVSKTVGQSRFHGDEFLKFDV